MKHIHHLPRPAPPRSVHLCPPPSSLIPFVCFALSFPSSLPFSLSISPLVSFRISRLSLFVARRKEEERMCIILLRIGHKVKCGQHKDRPARRVSVRHRKSDFSSFSLFSVDIIETSGVWLAFPSFFNFLSTTRQRSFFGYRFIVIKKKEEKISPHLYQSHRSEITDPRVIMGAITSLARLGRMNVQRLDITSLH